MSLWAEYAKEKWNWETIEADSGFLNYFVHEDGSFHISQIHVSKKSRKTGVGRCLIADLKTVASQCNIKSIRAKVWPSDKDATDTLKAAFACGFHVAGSEDGAILIKINIEE